MTEALLPAPGGQNLTLVISCTSHPRELEGRTHEVVIHPDWTVTTVHDLESERLARALGAWSSCLHFAESTVPAYRYVLDIMQDPTALHRGRQATTHNTTRGTCAVWPHQHARLRDAMRHEISAEHATGLFASTSWQLLGVDGVAHSQFLNLTSIARDLWCGAARRRDGRLELFGYALLWHAGVPPLQAAALASEFPLRTRVPLTRDYLLSAHYIPIERGTRERA